MSSAMAAAHTAVQKLMSTRAGRLCVTTAVCLVWMFFSSALIFVNKWILAVDKFEYPMTLSGMGMVGSSVASFLCCRVFKLVEAKKSLTWQFYLTRIMPVGLFMALTLAFGNIVYLYLTVAFIQMLKAFTPVITMLCAFLAGLEHPKLKLVGSVLLIAGGVAAASYGEVNFSVVGVAIMFASELCESIRLIMTQILLQGYKFNAIEGLMYMAPACVFWLCIGAGVMELPAMLRNDAFAKIAARPGMYLCASAMGFAVNSTAYLTIQLAGSLTLKILGTVKNAIVVWIGAVFWAESVTPLQLGGYGVSIAGFGMYNHHKMQAATADEKKQDKDGGYSAVPTTGGGLEDGGPKKETGHHAA